MAGEELLPDHSPSKAQAYTLFLDLSVPLLLNGDPHSPGHHTRVQNRALLYTCKLEQRLVVLEIGWEAELPAFQLPGLLQAQCLEETRGLSRWGLGGAVQQQRLRVLSLGCACQGCRKCPLLST